MKQQNNSNKELYQLFKVYNMFEKITEIFGSVRFWSLTAGVILLILSFYGIIPQELANILAGYLGISLVVRTVDKFRQ